MNGRKGKCGSAEVWTGGRVDGIWDAMLRYMGLTRDFKELRCYQEAFSTAMRIFDLSRGWPREEDKSLTLQVRRSSRSVAASIAEAWGKRRHPQHFVSKLSDADAECHESRSWVEFATACGYISSEELESLDDVFRKVSAMLTNMMSRPESWCGPNALRPPPRSAKSK